MTPDRRDELIANIEKDFDSHVATVKLDQEGIYILRWQKPGTWINAVEYVIRLNSLLVWGDLGEAIYQWSSNINLAFLAGLDIDYFRGKCQASEEGRGFEYWFCEEAVRYLETYCDDYDVDDKTRKVFEDNKRELIEACQSKDSWREWLRDSHNEEVREVLFGQDWWDFLPNIGIDAHPRCVMHLHGLKMAYRQIETTKAIIMGLDNVLNET